MPYETPDDELAAPVPGAPVDVPRGPRSARAKISSAARRRIARPGTEFVPYSNERKVGDPTAGHAKHDPAVWQPSEFTKTLPSGGGGDG